MDGWMNGKGLSFSALLIEDEIDTLPRVTYTQSTAAMISTLIL